MKQIGFFKGEGPAVRQLVDAGLLFVVSQLENTTGIKAKETTT